MTHNFIALALNTVYYGVVCVVCLVLGALTLNNLPMGAKPGFSKRLRKYLTTNIAQTAVDSEYPELELPTLVGSARLILTRVERAIATLGWEVTLLDNNELEVNAEIQSAIFRFKDDISVKLIQVQNVVEIHIVSKSRIGKGDFGTNTRHILNLLNAIDRQIEIET
jgi:hypothetical protein